ncbi:MAG: MBL fold metallo-hydrolase, partial [Candidatus Heimdallarchaeota archaeon]|nr:MBL fold metallo-hydrolase [Candidatus Heimdallarchaeota archaeon]
AGISRKRIFEGMNQNNLNPHDLDFILITHAHSDHISGLPVLYSYTTAKLLATKQTLLEIKKLKHLDIRYQQFVDNRSISMELGSSLRIDNLQIISLPTLHDIDGSTGYCLNYNNDEVQLFYMTDTGDIKADYYDYIMNSNIVLIESNHDLAMLNQSRRPNWLKYRIKNTHLSNLQTKQILVNLIDSEVQMVYLAHLSGECNSINEVAISVNQVYSQQSKWKWCICPRYEVSSITTFNSGNLSISNGITNETYKKLINFKLDSYF